MILHSNRFGEGQPFIILHGFLGMGDNWKTLGKKFAELGYNIHLVDQRNHGRSFHNDSFNYDVLTDDLKQYCDHYNIKDCVVLGHSMGGKTAMLFASKYPEYVSKLIIADIAPRYYPIHHDAILNGLEALDFNTITSRSAADNALKHYVPESSTRQFLLKNLYWENKTKLNLRLHLKALKEQVAEVGEALPNYCKFNKDTLVLKGDRSEYISENDQQEIISHFPKAQIKTIQNAGHWLHAENPKQFYTEVNHFLNP